LEGPDGAFGVVGNLNISDHDIYSPGTLITDTKADLNVYFRAKEGGSNGSCCGKSGEPATCQPKSFCCENAESSLDHLPDLSEFDLNELAGMIWPMRRLPCGMLIFWSGSFKIYAVKV
jgi:hypothetical protein